MSQETWSTAGVVSRLMIVDACGLGRAGLLAALSAERSGHALSVVSASSLSAARRTWCQLRTPDLRSGSGGNRGCLVVRLPADPRAALTWLLELGTPAARAMLAHGVTLLLTPVPAPRVRRLLAATGGDPAARMIDDSRSVMQLRHAVWSACRAAASVRDDIRHGAVCPAGPVLSERERRVLLFTLQGGAIAEMARRHAISHKTLYNQRHAALLKLGVTGVQGLFSLYAGTRHEAQP